LKLLLLICFSLVSAQTCLSQQNYWQQYVDYKINVELDDARKSLDGELKLAYTNNSPDTLNYIWFHIWPNAFKNDKTAFSDQLLENGRTDFYFSDEEQRGYINRLNFKVDGIAAELIDHAEHQDIVKLILPSALAPGKSINIETGFHVKLPYNFSRGGYSGNDFHITQWYPKPAVYDLRGWHEMPYLDQGEFYSEFGKYEVNISLPLKYTLAATGLQTKETIKDSIKTLTYVQDNVHDFAWFASNEFVVEQDTLMLGDKTIKLFAYYKEKNKKSWADVILYMKRSLRSKSEWLGVYPYPVASVVEREDQGGGMEYPTITLISTTDNARALEFVVNHELGHNWFYGILGSNERIHPWMDEGMNSYYDKKYSETFYREQPGLINGKSAFIQKRIPDDFELPLLNTLTRYKKDQPIETASESFTAANYGLIAYTKTALWLQEMEKMLGPDMFNRIMKTYYERWKFRHPYPGDFKDIVTEVAGSAAAEHFTKLNSKGGFKEDKKRKTLKVMTFFSMKDTDKYSYIFAAPVVGYNHYDKLMPGLIFHNYTLAPSKFLFFATPMYGTGSNSLNGMGRLSYNIFPGARGARLELALNGSRFTGDSFKDSTGKTNYQPYTRIVPSLKYVFANKDPRSPMTSFIQFRTFMFRETGLLFTRDPVTQADIITYPVNKRYVNQLQIVTENNRVLYPYKAIIQGEQGDGFVRTQLTGNYFFNFAKGGGLNLRLFAGKFFYTEDKSFLRQFETDRYHLNMTGAKGYEDYTYSNYFIGRNEFEKYSSQQIMIKDGGFKVRTDLLSNKIGRTDDWLTSINITSDFPDKFNPLKLLPIKLPLKLFLDAGTYAEAWKKDASTGRFLYDAGLQLSLLKNTINIYIPLFYSKEYDDYIKSTITEKKFWRNLSFSIDVQNLSLKKFIPQSPL